MPSSLRSSFLAAESDEPTMGTCTPAASTAKIVVITSSMSKNAATVFARGLASFQLFFVDLSEGAQRRSE